MAEPPEEDHGATLGAWTTLVRRARFGTGAAARGRKLSALTLASYANADGTGIHCGIARLALDLEVGYSTARRYLAWLRQAGLIELVRHGNARRGRSDEYRLVLRPEVLDHVEIPDPAEYATLQAKIRDANRAGSATRTARLRSHKSAETTKDGPVEPVENPESALTVASAEPTPVDNPSALTQDRAQKPPICAQFRPDLRSPLDERPPSPRTFPQLLTFPNHRDLRTNLTVVGHPQPPQDPHEDEPPTQAGTATPAPSALTDT